jgi:hypothetical protein
MPPRPFGGEPRGPRSSLVPTAYRLRGYRLRQDTNEVKASRWGITITSTIVVAGVGWLGIRQHRKDVDCRQRAEAFERRVDSIKQDALKELKVGAKKDDVARFYAGHNIPFTVVFLKDVGFEAIGNLDTVGGCAPFGCGTSHAVIGVRVKVDAEGTVAGEPEVVDLYTDCL